MGVDLAPDQRWRALGACVAGTSHAGTGQPCADACEVRVLKTATGGSLLVAAAADGAGNSERAPEGARLACEGVLKLARAWAKGPRKTKKRRPTRDLTQFDRKEVERWIESVRSRIEAAARAEQRDPHDFSCTLLVALVDEAWAVFFQIGDGAIVYRDEAGEYALAFWPQQGEYANWTWFVTDAAATVRVQSSLAERVHEVALLTDGLQGLALRFASREAHGPFFAPLFERLRREPSTDLDGLHGELALFLDSPAVNQRTDDDKTLVLATRLSAMNGNG